MWRRIGGWASVIYGALRALVDWLGRYDVVTNHAKHVMDSIGGVSLFAQALLESLAAPPPWTTLSIVILGLWLLYLDNKRVRGKPMAPSFSDMAARVYPHLSGRFPRWKKFLLTIRSSTTQVWLHPKDAFYKFAPHEAIRHYGALSQREIETEREIRAIQKKMESEHAKWYRQFGKMSAPITYPPPPKNQLVRKTLSASIDKRNATVNEKNIIYAEALQDFIKQLQRGDLRARGFRFPKNAGDSLEHIKPDEWYALKFDENWNIINVGPGTGYLMPSGGIAYIGASISTP